MDKQSTQKLVDQSVNIFLYILRIFEEFKALEPRQLVVKVDHLKSDVKCCVISIETPESQYGTYLHFISQNHESGIMNFMVSSCKKNEK